MVLTNLNHTKMTTEEKIKFRSATISDAKILLEWRNDPETRKQSINTEEVPLNKHIEWLGASLVNPNRKLLIAVLGEQNIGTVRLDTEEPYSEISWTVAPSSRGKGLGTKMVKAAVEFFNCPIKAKIKTDNIGSIRLAENSGFKKVSENGDITEWVFDPENK